jgi:hypothetical protein
MCTWKDPGPTLFDIRSEIVHGGESLGDEQKDDRPLENLPRPFEYRPESVARSSRFRDLRSCDDQRERNEHEDAHRHCQHDRQGLYLPPGSRLANAVGPIERVNRRVHGRRAAPQRAEGPEREQPGVTALPDQLDLRCDDPQHVGRRERAEPRKDLIENVARKDARQRDDHQ